MSKMQSELFRILDELFKHITGKSYERYATMDSFDNEIKKDPKRIIEGLTHSKNHPLDTLIEYYNRHSVTNFKDAKNIGGLKLVLSANSRFNKSHLSSIKKMLLYSDTILIPDPVSSWLEIDRVEEKYKVFLFVKSIFMLLQLKPIVEASLTSPAIFVFQSHEKILEAKDKVTIDGMDNFITNFFSFHLDEMFYSNKEVLEYSQKYQNKFLDTVEKKCLFVAPGEKIEEKLSISIKSYREYLNDWRSEHFLDLTNNTSDGQLVWLGINERVAPIWHLLENSNELYSQPLLAFDSHWHYYKLCTKMFDNRLNELGIIEKSNINLLHALNNERLNWLGNIPFETLARLREDNANETFRKKINEYTSHLNSANFYDLNKIVSDVSRGLSSLIAEHNSEVKTIEEKYKRKYFQNIVLSSMYTIGAIFIPALAPFINIIPPVGIAGKHIWESINNYLDYKKSSKSLMGVLASTNDQESEF